MATWVARTTMQKTFNGSSRVFGFIQSREAVLLFLSFVLLGQVIHTGWVLYLYTSVQVGDWFKVAFTSLAAIGIELSVLLFSVHGFKILSGVFALFAVGVNLHVFGFDFDKPGFGFPVIISGAMGLALFSFSHLFAKLEAKEQNNAKAELHYATHTINQLQSELSQLEASHQVDVSELMTAHKQDSTGLQDTINQLQNENDQLRADVVALQTEVRRTQTNLNQATELFTRLTDSHNQLIQEYDQLEAQAGKVICSACGRRFHNQQGLNSHKCQAVTQGSEAQTQP